MLVHSCYVSRGWELERFQTANVTTMKSYVAYRMAPLRVTFSDPESHFYCLKHLCPSAGKRMKFAIKAI